MIAARIRAVLKPWMMPIAIVLGMLFHNVINAIGFLAPYLIFAMLFVTFCKVKPREIRFEGFIWKLAAVQIIGALAIYFALLPLGSELAQGIFICIFCPTATAAPVITSMLGASPAKVVSYSLVSNLLVAVLAPLLFQWMYPASGAGETFISGLAAISIKVVPLIVLPMLAAFLLMFLAPKAHGYIARKQAVSFYLWCLSLIIVIGKAVNFVMAEPVSAIPLMIVMALVAGLACGILFIIGRKIGAPYCEKVICAQSLAQKNTVLAIWMALTYLSPISSVAPAAYIVWQNTVNAMQIYFKTRKEATN